jgi:hypothetical protein
MTASTPPGNSGPVDLNAVQSALTAMSASFEYSCGLLTATDANNASATSSIAALEQINQTVTNAVNQTNGHSDDPWSGVPTDGPIDPIKARPNPGRPASRRRPILTAGFSILGRPRSPVMPRHAPRTTTMLP